MKTNRTFTMLKPDSIEDGYMLPILNKISDSGFKIVALKYKKMNQKISPISRINSDEGGIGSKFCTNDTCEI